MIIGSALVFLLSVSTAAQIRGRQATPTTTEACSPSATVPDYFQISPPIFQGLSNHFCVPECILILLGPTVSGSAPFLAQTNPAPFQSGNVFIPNAPLETSEPIAGNMGNASIFQLMGNLSPYFPNPYPQCVLPSFAERLTTDDDWKRLGR